MNSIRLILIIAISPGLISAEHPVFDMDHWKAIFPYQEMFSPDRQRHFSTTPPDSPLDLRKPSGVIVDSPKDLVQVMEIRRDVIARSKLKESSISDVFVWANGEPPKPYLTKIGGCPYRAKNTEWPNSEGEKFQFIFQVYFGDSLDLVKKFNLPGNIMLVYGKGENFWADEKNCMKIEWVKAPIEESLYEEKDLPKPGFYVPHLHGVIYRTQEYSSEQDVFEKEGFNDSWLLSSLQATKIGTEPYWIQGEVVDFGYETFFSFSGPNIYTEKWPLINIEKLVKNKNFHGYSGNVFSFCMADCGTLYFSINIKGRVSCKFQCY